MHPDPACAVFPHQKSCKNLIRKNKKGFCASHKKSTGFFYGDKNFMTSVSMSPKFFVLSSCTCDPVTCS